MHNKQPNEEVHFFEEDITLPDFFDSKVFTDWIVSSVKKYDSQVNILNYILCSDKYLLEVNVKHLDHDFYTDIITFPFEEGTIIEGDIFISLDRISENAFSQNTSSQKELLRVMAHGFLHLIGFNDKSEEEKINMRKAEEVCISLFFNDSNSELLKKQSRKQ